MNDMAIRDGLTRIYNRRHLNECLNEYLSEAMVKKLPVTLALFDIDKFKMINDTYGHQCGDEVIRYVAALLDVYKRQGDEVWGIFTDPEIRIDRLLKSRGYSREKSLSIMQKQMSYEELKQKCSHVLFNDEDPDKLWEQIKELLPI